MIEIWSRTQLYVEPIDNEDLVRRSDVLPGLPKDRRLLATVEGNVLLTTDGYVLITKS